MKCERIQELVLTDYLDGQLKADQKDHIEQHLSQCPQCQAFAQAARQTAFEPFRQAQRLNPPESVWSAIKTSIEAQQEKTNIFVHLWEKIKSFAWIPNPAVALTIVATLLVVGTLTGVKIRQEANAKESSEYLESLAEVPGDLSFNDGEGFGTNVEQYFL